MKGERKLWIRRRRVRVLDGRVIVLCTGDPVLVTILHQGPRATRDAGPGSGGGSKVKVWRHDLREETYVYARNLKGCP